MIERNNGHIIFKDRPCFNVNTIANRKFKGKYNAETMKNETLDKDLAAWIKEYKSYKEYKDSKKITKKITNSELKFRSFLHDTI